jgi:protein involved in polysaccharide export with SLBB domain
MKTYSAWPSPFSTSFAALLRGVALTLAWGVLLGCRASTPLPTRSSSTAIVPAEPAGTEAVSNDYRINAADVLDIAVYQEEDLKSTLRVSREGTITFPLIGVVSVGGRTPLEAGAAIREKLAKGYINDPQVSVTVLQFSKRRFTVLGEVQKPGSYDMPDQQEVTVLQAIGMAGGYTRIANPSKVTLMRRTNGRDDVMALNAKRMASGSVESIVLVQPGDVITVAESRF